MSTPNHDASQIFKEKAKALETLVITESQAMQLRMEHLCCPAKVDINAPEFVRLDGIFIRARTVALITYGCPLCKTEVMIAARVEP